MKMRQPEAKECMEPSEAKRGKEEYSHLDFTFLLSKTKGE